MFFFLQFSFPYCLIFMQCTLYCIALKFNIQHSSHLWCSSSKVVTNLIGHSQGINFTALSYSHLPFTTPTVSALCILAVLWIYTVWYCPVLCSIALQCIPYTGWNCRLWMFSCSSVSSFVLGIFLLTKKTFILPRFNLYCMCSMMRGGSYAEVYPELKGTLKGSSYIPLFILTQVIIQNFLCRLPRNKNTDIVDSPFQRLNSKSPPQ